MATVWAHTGNGWRWWWHLIGEKLPDGNPDGIGQTSQAVNGWVVGYSSGECDTFHPHGISGRLDCVAVGLKCFFYFHILHNIKIHGQR